MHPRLETRRIAIAAAQHGNRRPAGSPRLSAAEANKRADELLATERARVLAMTARRPLVRWPFTVALVLTLLLAAAVLA
jgi:hypothetical protein